MQVAPSPESDPRVTAFFALVRLFGWWTAILVLIAAAVAVGATLLGKQWLLVWLQRRAGIAFDLQLAEHKGKLDADLETRRASFATELATHTAVLNRELEAHRAAFATELATHTAALDRQAEQMRQLYREQQQRFELYTGSQHRVYPELYRRLRKAQGALVHVGLVTDEPDYATATTGQLERIGARAGIDQDVLTRLIGLWINNRPEGTRQFEAALAERQRARGQRVYAWARDYALLNELYLSDQVSGIMATVIQNMDAYARLARDPQPGEGSEMLRLSVQIQFYLLELRNAMQAELRA